ncbi:hypothetical protein N7474_009401 [Penicillium riverlandense]|uniref:uncharacterized protein n=1 Tax=Penicillium riverlandense TaxID=1903569 RepID=UPI0025494660|nr:uncharacterized protein N7474_009401 [Penicillium riverlandense]KAJ5808132.1 hypothetical protein N7474_009401 [Penicillium riverlandense]
MSRFSTFFDKSRTQHEDSDHPWSNIGSAGDHLLRELESLYWVGANQELDCIISTLKHWQQSKFENAVSPDEDPQSSMVEGFDTFINQVIPKTPIKNKAPIEPAQLNNSANKIGPTERLLMNLHHSATERAAEKTRRKVNIAVHKRLVQRPANEGPFQRLARLLLQGAGFLDIEKVIEYHPRSSPPPISPQLRLGKKLLSQCPVVTGLPCSECKKNIQGCTFKYTTTTRSSRIPRIVCEDCYWDFHYGDTAYVKVYKHSIRDEVEDALKKHSPCFLCGKNSARVNSFSSQMEARIIHALGDAKYRGIQKTRKRDSSFPKSLLEKVIQEGMGHSHLLDDKWLFEDFVQENPWEDVSMAVRIGPLVIENGLKQ